MDLYLCYVIPPGGSTTLSAEQMERLALLAYVGLAENKRVFINAGFGESLGTQQRPPVVVTMSLDSPSTSLQHHQCSQTLGVCGRPQGGSGVDVTAMTSTSEFGKGE